jgi:hypothetical protein
VYGEAVKRLLGYMSESVAWRDAKYNEVFEQELRGLHRRRSSDSNCRPEDIEGILKSLYIMDGSDWIGRGELQDIIIAATIAAYEHFVKEWKME